MVNVRVLVNTKERLLKLLKLIENETHISFDTENGGEYALNPKFAKAAGFSVSINNRVGYYVPVDHIDLKIKDVWAGSLKDLMLEVFKNKKLVIMHNTVYDAGILKAQYDYDVSEPQWFDTMIAQHLIDEKGFKGLKKITKRYFGVDQDEFIWDDATKTSAESIYEYACDDAIFTFKHFERLKENIKEEKLSALMMDIEMPFQKTLLHIRRNGIQFDIEKAKEIEAKLITDKEVIVNEIIEKTPEVNYITDLFGKRKIAINLDSSKDLVRLLYDTLNLPVNFTTPKGAPAVDLDALKAMKETVNSEEYMHAIIPLLIKYKEIQKLISTYTSSLYNKVMPDGRLYCQLVDHGARTGRLSSRDPNFQNLPKNDTYKVRSFFSASPGYIMFVPDFSQEELKVCGVVTNSPTFRKVYAENQDLHLKVANEIWKLGIPDEELITTHPKYKEHCETYYKYRFNAKSINFGLMYGRSAYGLQTQIGGSIEECQKVVKDYFETFPEIKHAIELTKKEVKLRGYVRNLYSRKRRFEKVTSEHKGEFYTNGSFREAFNFKIQGSCGDILRIVMNGLHDYINTVPNDEVRMLTTVHDEIMFEMKDNSNFEQHKLKIIDIMENTVQLGIPLTVDGNTGQDYGECK